MIMFHPKLIRYFIALTAIVLLFSACDRRPVFQIAGSVPDHSYDGEWVYLVPLENAPVERVDSTQIADGRFHFSGRVDSAEIYVLRTRPLLRAELQELLIVKEPGQIQAFLGRPSRVAGTALNDSLQAWKEQKEKYDRIFRQAIREFRDTHHPVAKATLDSLRQERRIRNFRFLRNNKENVVGRMVFRFTKGMLTEEEKDELQM